METATKADKTFSQKESKFSKFVKDRFKSKADSSLADVLRSRRFTLMFLAFIVAAMAAIITYLSTAPKTTIDEDAKTGLIVVASIIVAITIAALLALLSNVFKFTFSNEGLRYPFEVQRLFWVIFAIGVGLTITLYSTTAITSQSVQTGLTWSLFAVTLLAGGAALYFGTTLIPLDYDTLKEFFDKTAASAKFITKSDFTDRKDTVRAAFVDANVIDSADINVLLSGTYSDFLREAPELLSLDDLQRVESTFQALKTIDPVTLRQTEIEFLLKQLRDAKTEPVELQRIRSAFKLLNSDETSDAVKVSATGVLERALKEFTESS